MKERHLVVWCNFPYITKSNAVCTEPQACFYLLSSSGTISGLWNFLLCLDVQYLACFTTSLPLFKQANSSISWTPNKACCFGNTPSQHFRTPQSAIYQNHLTNPSSHYVYFYLFNKKVAWKNLPTFSYLAMWHAFH